MGNVCCAPSVVIYVLSSQTRGVRAWGLRFVHQRFSNSNCHLDAQVLSSHGVLLFHGWALEGVIPVLASVLPLLVLDIPRNSLRLAQRSVG